MAGPKQVLILVSLLLCAAGCRQSDGAGSRQSRLDRPQATDRKPTNVSEKAPPKILPETRFAAARLFERQGYLGKAIAQYREAVALNHNFTPAYHALGLVLSRVGRHDEACEALRRAVELQPNDAVLRNNLGYELVLTERWEEAEIHLLQAIEIEPKFVRAYINLGLVQSRLGRFEEAYGSFCTVLQRPDAHYNLGLMYRGQRRYEEAAHEFRKVLQLNPNFSAAQAQLVQITPTAQAPSREEFELFVEDQAIQGEMEFAGNSGFDTPTVSETSESDFFVAEDPDERDRRAAQSWSLPLDRMQDPQPAPLTQEELDRQITRFFEEWNSHHPTVNTPAARTEGISESDSPGWPVAGLSPIEQYSKLLTTEPGINTPTSRSDSTMFMTIIEDDSAASSDVTPFDVPTPSEVEPSSVPQEDELDQPRSDAMIPDEQSPATMEERMVAYEVAGEVRVVTLVEFVEEDEGIGPITATGTDLSVFRRDDPCLKIQIAPNDWHANFGDLTLVAAVVQNEILCQMDEDVRISAAFRSWNQLTWSETDEFDVPLMRATLFSTVEAVDCEAQWYSTIEDDVEPQETLRRRSSTGERAFPPSDTLPVDMVSFPLLSEPFRVPMPD